jgi:hypothetical protein
MDDIDEAFLAFDAVTVEPAGGAILLAEPPFGLDSDASTALAVSGEEISAERCE